MPNTNKPSALIYSHIQSQGCLTKELFRTLQSQLKYFPVVNVTFVFVIFALEISNMMTRKNKSVISYEIDDSTDSLNTS